MRPRLILRSTPLTATNPLNSLAKLRVSRMYSSAIGIRYRDAFLMRETYVYTCARHFEKWSQFILVTGCGWYQAVRGEAILRCRAAGSTGPTDRLHAVAHRSP